MEKLELLRQLFHSGYISHEEYNTRKNQIVDQLTNTSVDPQGAQTPSVPCSNTAQQLAIPHISQIPCAQTCHSTQVKNIFTQQQRVQLVFDCAKLSEEAKLKLLEIVQQKRPDLIKIENNEFTFDLQEMDDQTLLTISEYISNQIQIEEKVKEFFAKTPNTEEKSEPSKKPIIQPLENPSNKRPCQTSLEEESKNKKPKLEKFVIHVRIISTGKKNDGPTPFVCDICEKSFKDKSNLVKHVRTHTKEKPFVCTIEGCGKRFSHNQTLKEHMNVHCGIKPFVCSYCKKAFASEANMKRHQRIHTGDKPFVCPVCGKAFTQNGNLKTHLKKIHKFTKEQLSEIK